MITTFSMEGNTPYLKNRLSIGCTLLFVLFWSYCYLNNTDTTNWWIENILVLLFFPWFLWLRKRFAFSDISIISIFLFLCLHTFGAKNAYTYNSLGLWMKEYWQLARNPYDRIVHFGFGFFICYPIADYLYRYLKVPFRWVFVLTNGAILCLATIFELIEWMVAECTDSATGDTYVATQGDIWDAQKDIVLAWLASFLVMQVVKFLSRRKLNANPATSL